MKTLFIWLVLGVVLISYCAAYPQRQNKQKQQQQVANKNKKPNVKAQQQQANAKKRNNSPAAPAKNKKQAKKESATGKNKISKQAATGGALGAAGLGLGAAMMLDGEPEVAVGAVAPLINTDDFNPSTFTQEEGGVVSAQVDPMDPYFGPDGGNKRDFPPRRPQPRPHYRGGAGGSVHVDIAICMMPYAPFATGNDGFNSIMPPPYYNPGMPGIPPGSYPSFYPGPEMPPVAIPSPYPPPPFPPGMDIMQPFPFPQPTPTPFGPDNQPMVMTMATIEPMPLIASVPDFTKLNGNVEGTNIQSNMFVSAGGLGVPAYAV